MKTLKNALLCLAVLQLCPSSSYSSGGPLTSCCLKTSETKVARAKIKDYYEQKMGMCPVEAVVFVTMKEKRLCSDPTSQWVKRTMDYVNGKKRVHSTTTIRSTPLSTETSAISWNTTNTTNQT
ncbi:hypothetical protein SKAU_G00064810 [Synaphobranchus kaupii]|uniref:Chemokine interleukin-8-like domain-containing protein n=1 Tax=Synaphobranchus kaupii TaxID=118154 RepID=A0A9Q1J9Y8_SYNKA|nr:hypothetical protein SKAU_G00064810 [Synaphobranchus kaupii]